MTIRPEDIVHTIRLHLGVAGVGEGDHLTEDLGATSADLVNIVATLEERFGIEIDDTDMAGVETVRDLVDVAVRIEQGGQ